MFSHVLSVGCSHAETFVFIPTGFEISTSEISTATHIQEGDWNFAGGANSNETSHLKNSSATSLSSHRALATLDNPQISFHRDCIFGRKLLQWKLSKEICGLYRVWVLWHTCRVRQGGLWDRQTWTTCTTRDKWENVRLCYFISLVNQLKIINNYCDKLIK